MTTRRTYPNANYHHQQQYGHTNSPSDKMASTRTQEMIEQENDEMVAALHSKVSVLKTLTIDMGDEVKQQNTFLGNMGTEFDSTGGLLSGSMKRLKAMGKAGHNSWMCYMVIFIVFVFLVLYFVVRWRR